MLLLSVRYPNDFKFKNVTVSLFEYKISESEKVCYKCARDMKVICALVL